MKFLHISDVHLGCTRYNLPTSPRDFFDAWIDVIQKYAVGEKVDFVIMGGDFFHKRSVPPETMNYAFAGLSILKDAGIPVVTIEGNHDQKHSDSEYSWLRSLANWNLLYLVEPTPRDGKIVYEQWNDETNRGGFIDIGRARIFGSHWYGSSANWAIPMLTDSIRENRREGAFHILLLHTDVEGHQTHPMPALSIVAFKELKAVTDYVGLGHTHKHYEIDNWAFNPGSLEITSIDEYRETRGAFLVEVDQQNNITARHLQDYRQRPFVRFSFDVTPCTDPKDVTDGVLDKVRTACVSGRSVREGHHFADDNANENPVIEITLRGQLGFPNSQLELQKIREEAQKLTNALAVRTKNNSVPVEYAIAPDLAEDAGREKLERRVIEDLVARDSRYKKNFAGIAEAVIGAKRLALIDEEPEKIADFIAAKLSEPAA